MLEQTVDDLANNLRRRRALAHRPPVLLLGAGASMQAGVGTMQQLYEFFKVSDFEAFCKHIEPLTAEERYLYLSDFLQTQKPAEVTPGYRALAALCAENYFDLVLSTNFDPLLDDALAAARLWRRDYLLLAGGIVRPERVGILLREPSPRVKVVKLHGDLFHRYMAWTPQEMDDYVTEIKPQLAQTLAGRDVLVIGHSLRDERIRELVMGAGGTIWYTHPQGVPDELKANKLVRAVVGPECKFEELMTKLAEALGAVPVSPAPAKRPATKRARATRGGASSLANAVTFGLIENLDLAANVTPAPAPHKRAAKAAVGAQTIDDLMASIVGLIPGDGGPTGQPICTGFLLAEPRVIVTEGYAGGALLKGDSVLITTADGRRTPSRVVKRGAGHPHAPVLVEAPDSLLAPGLALDAGVLTPGLHVRVGVAAGARVGLSSGTIEEAGEVSMTVDPVGPVPHLVKVECVVAPGSAGAPVIDEKFAVRGYIVAGSMDRPPSLMYPSARWAKLIKGVAAPRRRARG